MKDRLCPCCSGKRYAECCLPFHEGKLPHNALALMRSRYSAYALALPVYIIETTHSQNPAYEKDKTLWSSSILNFSHHTKFKKLEILDFLETQEVAYVTFVAYLEQNTQDASFQETSRFEKEDGRWKYLSGVLKRL